MPVPGLDQGISRGYPRLSRGAFAKKAWMALGSSPAMIMEKYNIAATALTIGQRRTARCVVGGYMLSSV